MIGLQRIEVEGKRFVLLEEGEYERLCRAGGDAADVDERDLPAFPPADSRGRFPALEYTRVSLARDLIRARKGVRLSQQQLADLTGLRQETISRLETGKYTARPGTVDKIMDAIEAQRRKQGRNATRPRAKRGKKAGM
jgi:DNA-binding XRE family transcriptional regulator